MDDTTTDDATQAGSTRRRPSLVLLLAGIAALLLAVPTIVGSNPTAIVSGLVSGWTVLVVAVVVGVALVLAPVRRRAGRR